MPDAGVITEIPQAAAATEPLSIAAAEVAVAEGGSEGTCSAGTEDSGRGCCDVTSDTVVPEQSPCCGSRVLSLADYLPPAPTAWLSEAYVRIPVSTLEDPLDSSFIQLEEVPEEGGAEAEAAAIGPAEAGPEEVLGKAGRAEMLAAPANGDPEVSGVTTHTQQQHQEQAESPCLAISTEGSQQQDRMDSPCVAVQATKQPEVGSRVVAAATTAVTAGGHTEQARGALEVGEAATGVAVDQQQQVEDAVLSVTGHASVSTGLQGVTVAAKDQPEVAPQQAAAAREQSAQGASGGQCLSLEAAWAAAIGSAPTGMPAEAGSDTGTGVGSQPPTFAAAWAAATGARTTSPTAVATGTVAAGTEGLAQSGGSGLGVGWATATGKSVSMQAESAPLPQLPAFNVAVDAATAQLMKEMAVMKKLDHPNVVKLFEVSCLLVDVAIDLFAMLLTLECLRSLLSLG